MRRASYYFIRSFFFILIGFCLTWPCAAQDPNPQSGFAPTVLYAAPSTYLNFNDQTSSFKEQISGASFTSGATSTTFTVGAIVAPLAGGTNNQIQFSSAPSPAGSLESVSVQYASAPASGQSLTVLIGSVSGSHVTIINSFTLTVASTTALQTFVTGTNFSPITMATGQIIGFWNGSGIGPAQGSGSSYQHYYTAASTYPTGTYSFVAYSSPPAISAVVQTATSGTVTPRQPGFDSTLLNNTSASFGWNTYATAPNNTLGAIEWSSPWSMMVQVDQLNWSRTGTLVLASKGDLATGNSWELYLQMAPNARSGAGAGAQVSQLCFQRTSSAGFSNGVCTSYSVDVMPNGFNYNIIVEDAGTGGPIQFDSSIPNPLTIYINGLTTSDMGIGTEPAIANYGSVGFGSVSLSASGGTGYANSTNYTSTGGGANCIVTGVMLASGGVPTSVQQPNGYADLGCTSVPTIVLTSPTGTGVTITGTLRAPSMNSTTSPLMVPGYVSGGTTYGVAGTTSTQTPTTIDEFAIFPFNLSMTQIHDLFYWTKFYQGLVYPRTGAAAPVVIFDNDSCGGDPSGDFALAMTIGEHLHGVFQIEGVVDSVLIQTGADPSLGWYRQMLDSAGLSNVPVSVALGALPDSNSNCSADQLAIYNASTPVTLSSYGSPTTMIRQIYASNPTLPIIYLAEGPLNAYAAFLQSPADGISSLTGLQLQAQNAANGGFLSVEGGECAPPAWGSCTITLTGSGHGGSNNTNVPAAGQYVMANNGAMPIYFETGNPQDSGPGTLYTRTAKDPFYLTTLVMYAEGLGLRPGWNTMQTAMFVSPYFTGGLSGITLSGGTGYANLTPFTSTGGGTYCSVQGLMTASGGVPNGIEYTWGMPFTNATPPSGNTPTWSGATIGHGCTSVPTLVLTNPTGTGVTLTGVPSYYCMNDTITETAGVWSEVYTNTSCTNHWQDLVSDVATAGGPPIFQWFQNSLIDPPPNGRPPGVQ